MNQRQKKKRVKVQLLKSTHDDIIVFKYDPSHMGIESVVNYMNSLKDIFKNHEAIIIPEGVDIRLMSKDKVKQYMNQLQKVLGEVENNE